MSTSSYPCETSGSLIHISGQYGSTKDGKYPACYESQIHLVLLKLRRAIAAAGAEASDICKMTVYVVGYDHADRVHERHFQRFLEGHEPAFTVMPVARLAGPEALVQVEAVLCKGPTLKLDLAAKRATCNALKLSKSTNEKVYDVIVVGAGLSGLAAARDVVEAGLSCLVLEARDRVGGKTLSQPMKKSGAMVELGGAWLNDTTETRMIGLARKYGAELIEQNVDGNAVLQDLSGVTTVFPYGGLPQFDEKTQEHLEHIGNIVDQDTQKIDVWSPHDPDLDSMNLATYLRTKGANDIALNTASTWTRAMMGQEPRDISALYFLNYCRSFGGLLQLRSDEKDGGQHIRVAQGVQMISRGLASDLPEGTVRLSTQVYSIARSHDSPVSVTTPYGVLYARKAIVSLPTPAYKTIDFHPPLPADKLVLASSAHFNYYTKVMLAFKNPFWTSRGFCGLAQSFCGPASVMRDVSIPSRKQWVLACFMAGDAGRAWSLLPAEEKHEQLLGQVARLFADRETVDEEFVESIDYDWSQEQFSGWGCPCPALPPGVLDTVGHALREVVGDVHFVGVETAGEFKGFMEGAVRSGERGAKEVIACLKRTETASGLKRVVEGAIRSGERGATEVIDGLKSSAAAVLPVR